MPIIKTWADSDTRRLRLSSRICMAVITIFMGFGPAAMAEAPSSTVYLVRHAEKEKNRENPILSEAGASRAEFLADLLDESGITVIWSTDFNRTRLTAEPLATRLGIPVTIYDHKALEDLAAMLADSGQVSLVVGHSNTTTEMVSLLGGNPGSPIDDNGEYDRLYRVHIQSNGVVDTELKRYGTAYAGQNPAQSEK